MELPPEAVIEIISYLPFKQAARLSLVAKRWRNLYREMKNVVFKESEFVKVPFTEKGGTTLERVSFVHQMHQWISTTFPGYFINRFEIYFPEPYGFQESITPLIEFAVSKQVKILVLDFSKPNSGVDYRETVIRLPGCVYDQTTTLKSLKLISCNIDSTKFKNSTVLRSLTIGHVVLEDLTTLLSNFPSLESLRFIRCYCEDYDVMITENHRLTELVFEDCDFSESYVTLELPKVVIFKCSGNFISFTFDGVINQRMQEAFLDFGLVGQSASRTGGDLGKLLNGVSPAKALTICSFTLQMIPYDEEELLTLGTLHLVMQTNLHPYEFIGISLMIDKCPVLESLTFALFPERTMKTVLVQKEFNADTYWLDEITHECLKKTLKVVVVKDFGNMYELQILTYLIKHGLVLERLDLYINEDQRSRVEMALQNVPRGSSRLQITLHNA